MLKISPIKREDTAYILDCGEKDINDLMQSAYIATLQKQGLAFNAFVDNNLVAQIMLTMTIIQDPGRDSLPNCGFPSVKIEYIAVDSVWQHQGIGTIVLKTIVDYVREQSNNLPIRFVYLESVEDKVAWYSEFGFSELAKDLKTRYQDGYTVPMCIDFLDEKAVEEYLEEIS